MKGQGCPQQIPLSPRGSAASKHRNHARHRPTLFEVLLKGQIWAAASSLVPRDATAPRLLSANDRIQQLSPYSNHWEKSSQNWLRFFSSSISSLVFFHCYCCLSQVAWHGKSSPFMMKYVGPGEALSAEKPTNGQEQLVFLLTGHTVLNAILSSPALRDTHTHQHSLYPTLNSHLANKLFNYSIPQGRQRSFQMQLPARLSHTRNGLIG